MPVWSVSEPYISLWLHDEPLGYQPALGPRISFELAFKQREFTAGLNTNIFNVGKKWNSSWFSYVTQDVYTNNVVHLPGGKEVTFFRTNDYLTNTRLTGDTTNGFTLSNPDGSQDVYGFVVTNSSGAFQEAFLTEQWNAQSQKTRLNYATYNPTNPVIRLQTVVDGDGRTNTISYVAANSYSTNLISQVVDAFGRTNSLAYDDNGHLTNIIDVAGISSSFVYDTNDWVTNLITPYGTNSFVIADTTTNNIAPDGRSVLITEPDGSQQLYLYTNSAPGIASSYSTNEIPATTPYTNSFDNSELNLRNTFHWGRRQYAALSTTNISALTSNDFRKARMQHWLKSYTYSPNAVGQTLSLIRTPSPDSAGSIEGQKTWYDYTGKIASDYEGTQVLPMFVARVLPDGTTAFSRNDRNSLGFATNEVSTFSVDATTIGVQTNEFAYATNAIDLVAATNALGVQVTSNAYNAYHQVVTNYNALNELTVFSYNANQQLASVKTPAGLTTTNIYFSSGSFTNWLAETIDLEISRTNSFTYLNGLVYSQTDPRGLTVTNTWDNLQRLTSQTYPDGTFITNTYDKLDLVKVVDRMGYSNSFTYNSVRQLVAQTNALGRVTLYNYCTCGALSSITDPLNQVTSFFYDNAGHRTNTVYADGYGVTNNYNLIGQLTNSVDRAGTSITNWFNNQGLPVAISNAFGQASKIVYDVLDRATNSVDANGVTITNTFDNLNRLLTRGYPDGGVETFVYSANVRAATSYTNQLGSNVVNYAYDAAGRKTSEVYPGITTNQYSYNAAGDRLTLTDGKSQTTSWNYNQFGLVTNKVDAAANVLFVYTYDSNNRLTNRLDALSHQTQYFYDAVGNQTNIIYNTSTNIQLSYDALNRLTNMVDAAGTTVYGYTSFGALLSEDGPWANDTVSYTYDNGRRRSSLTLLAPNASAWTQSYGYDSASRMTNITSPAGVFTCAYDATRQLQVNKLTLPNTAYITNLYDTVARLTGTYLKNSGDTNLNSHQYSYNVGNQRIQQVFTATNYVDYTYDNIGQLKTAKGKESGGTTNRLQEQFGYTYDAAGNLNWRTNNALVQAFNVNNLNELTTATNSGTLTVAGTTTSAATNVTVNSSNAVLYLDNTFAKESLTVTNGSNTYKAIAKDSYGRSDTNSITATLSNSVPYTYDLNGNLTSDGTRAFDYDNENQLLRVTVTNKWKSEFTYDGKMRRRIRKEYTWTSTWVQTNEVRYVYDANLVIQERDANNLPTISYTRGRDFSGSLQSASGIGGLLARTDHGSQLTVYYHADGNGNVTALINAQQLIVAKYLYDSFGNVLSMSGPLADANLYRFSSKEYHPNSGLVYYLYRYYEPNLQRWPNRDPIDELGGLNLYRFVGNDPVNSVDFLGLVDCDALASTIAHMEGTIRSAIQSMSDINQQFDNALWSSYASLGESLLAAGYSLGSLTASLSANAAKNATYVVSVSRGTIPVGVIGLNTTDGIVVISGSGIAGPVSAANGGATLIGLKEAGSGIGQEGASRLSTGVQRVLDPFGRLADVQNQTGAQMSASTYQTIRGMQSQLGGMISLYNSDCLCKK